MEDHGFFKGGIQLNPQVPSIAIQCVEVSSCVNYLFLMILSYLAILRAHQCNVLWMALLNLSKASSMKINLHKSQMVVTAVQEKEKEKSFAVIWLSEGKLPFRNPRSEFP